MRTLTQISEVIKIVEKLPHHEIVNSEFEQQNYRIWKIFCFDIKYLGVPDVEQHFPSKKKTKCNTLTRFVFFCSLQDRALFCGVATMAPKLLMLVDASSGRRQA